MGSYITIPCKRRACFTLTLISAAILRQAQFKSNKNQQINSQINEKRMFFFLTSIRAGMPNRLITKAMLEDHALGQCFSTRGARDKTTI